MVIEAKYPWFVPFSASMIRLAEAHARVGPFDAEASKQLCSTCLTTIVQAADEVVRIPEFAKLYQQPINPQTGDTAELTMALAKYAAANLFANVFPFFVPGHLDRFQLAFVRLLRIVGEAFQLCHVTMQLRKANGQRVGLWEFPLELNADFFGITPRDRWRHGWLLELLIRHYWNEPIFSHPNAMLKGRVYNSA
ncbi:MAG: hypothetical protein ACYDC6_02055 [Acidobacteriaceae bacterium]